MPDTDVRILLQATTDPQVVQIPDAPRHRDRRCRRRGHARLEALGAVSVDHQQERGLEFWVLQDPWKNEFCVLHAEFAALLSDRPA
ncbi:VOC family protein [Nocardia salmonicida]|uniref:VOC family protein n=1 Tax=Nocardia salmonicida TaxID=53431 RepID=UPI00147216F5|nr:hypothetical protein [Nocardia sp.]